MKTDRQTGEGLVKGKNVAGKEGLEDRFVRPPSVSLILKEICLQRESENYYLFDL